MDARKLQARAEAPLARRRRCERHAGNLDQDQMPELGYSVETDRPPICAP
jgi:hypothetical protein